MRFPALALGAVAFVGFAVGSDTQPANSTSYSDSVKISTSSHPHWHPSKTMSVSKKTTSSSLRAVARFAEPTITTEPTPAVAGDTPYTTLPICSFNPSAGRYDCPKVASYTTPPICSFNLSKGMYDCPTPKAAEATAAPVVKECPENVERCSFGKGLGHPRIPVPVKSAHCPSGMIGPRCSKTVSQGHAPTTMHTVRKA